MKQILLLLIISGHLYGQDTALAQTIHWGNAKWDSASKLDTIRLSAGKGTVIYQSNDTVYSRLDTIPWKPYFRKPKVKREAWFKTFPVKEWFPDQSKTEYGIIQHQTPDTVYIDNTPGDIGIYFGVKPWYSGDHWWKWLGFWVGALTVFFTIVIIVGVWIIKDHPFDHREEEMREENLQK